MIMKLRYFLLAMLAMTATTLSAQTMTTASWASKARTARSVANDLRQKKVQKATTTVLKDKDVRSQIKLDKDLEQKLTTTNYRTTLAKAKADVRKDPVTFGEKAYQEARKYKKFGPQWLRPKTKKRTTAKK
jgi:hypothetical protein